MLLCDSEQIGREWTQERLMMMPAANISASSATPATTAAGSSCSSSPAKLKGSMLQQHDPQQHVAVAAAGTAALKCPRCDSSNTKFCYYNNYSLSQPRHFCKACKRYWTRGGTLRNVPVGGGCRKNKRAKKPSHHQQHQQQPAAAATSTGSATVAADPPQQQPSQSSATIDLSSFMYSADMNLTAFSSTAAYGALGLGGLIPTSQLSTTELISNNLADLQQQPASFLNDDYSPSFGSQAASLLVSSLKQQPTMKAEDYQSSLLLPYDAGANLGFLKDVKVEGDNNLNSNDNGITEWLASYPLEANGASDASNLYWMPAMGGAGGWPEAANPSIAHLI